MSMTLRNFDQHLPTRIVERALEYLENGRILNWHASDGMVRAQVAGTENYEVQIRIDGDNIIDHHCTCPYDQGDMCKHIAATLFVFRDQHGLASGAEQVPNKFQQVMNALSPDEMRAFLLELSASDQTIENKLMARFAHHLPGNEVKKLMRKLVSDRIRQARRGQYGFIHYRECAQLGYDLYALLKEKNEINPEAVYLAEAVITKLAAAYQKGADDSSGDLGMALSSAFTVLMNVEHAANHGPAADDLQSYVHKLALREMNKEKYEGFDWEFNWVEVAVQSAASVKQAKKLIGRIEERIGEKLREEFGEYGVNFLSVQIYHLLAKWDSPAVAKTFLYDNLEYDDLRDEAIKLALEAEDEREVVRLAEEGKSMENHRPDSHWDNWLLILYEQTGDTKKQLALLEKFLFSSRGFGFSLDIYHRIKALIPPEDMPERTDRYISFFREKAGKGYFSIPAAEIMREEQRWSDLIALLQENPKLHHLDTYLDSIGKHFPQQTVALLEEVLVPAMDEVAKRSEYRRLVRHLPKMVKMGGDEAARRVAVAWRTQHTRRRAMMEELAKKGF